MQINKSSNGCTFKLFNNVFTVSSTNKSFMQIQTKNVLTALEYYSKLVAQA